MKLNELLIQAAKKYGYSYTLNEKGLFVTHGHGHGRKKRSSPPDDRPRLTKCLPVARIEEGRGSGERLS